MVTVHPLGIVRYRWILIGTMTLTKDTSVQSLVTISLCVRPQSCPQKSGTDRVDPSILYLGLKIKAMFGGIKCYLS